MWDGTGLTRGFAFALDRERCLPCGQGPGVHDRPWLESMNEATRRQGFHCRSMRGSWNLSEFGRRKVSWLCDSCPVAVLGPDGTISLGEEAGRDAEPYFSVLPQDPDPTPQSCPQPLSSALVAALEKDALRRVEALGCQPSTVIMRCIGDRDEKDGSLLIDCDQSGVSFNDLEESKGIIVAETWDGACFLEWTTLDMTFGWLAHTVALQDVPGWNPLEPSCDPDCWLHVEWTWSGETGAWSRESRTADFSGCVVMPSRLVW
ncbi:MAG: hypothetical protein F4103_14540 [Boseongicola sp. SB0673_bin_14]|nr:hypothetical protein [Boseongicola sp. SB0667_bin_21]MYI69898.1 hypothetical protein [Boseongicola sp. SB0673_bin_14]